MKRKTGIIRWSGSIIAIGTLLGACASSEKKEAQKQPPAAPPPPAATQVEAAQPPSSCEKVEGMLQGMGGKVTFGVNQANFDPAAVQTVTQIGQELAKDPSLKIRVEAFTDDTGTDQYNQKLSEERAKAVSAALIQQGARSDQVEAVGHGEATPVASNDTSEGRAENRRAQLTLITESTA